MNYAVINNGIVVNVVMWDGVSQFNPGTGSTLVLIPSNTPVNIGDSYNGTTFTPAA
jgi:hypothetical protein